MMRVDRWRWRSGVGRQAVAAVLACAVTFTGCYSTTALEQASPAPPMRVVADLTPSGALELAEWIGPEAVAIEGHIVEIRGAEWDVSLLRVDHRTTSVRWTGERVTFPAGTLRNVRERKLDSVRTVAFVGGVAAAAAALAVSFIRFIGPGDEGPPGGGTPLE